MEQMSLVQAVQNFNKANKTAGEKNDSNLIFTPNIIELEVDLTVYKYDLR
jgi:hypothetical protein